MARVDPHSYFDDAQPRTKSWRLRLDNPEADRRGHAAGRHADDNTGDA